MPTLQVDKLLNDFTGPLQKALVEIREEKQRAREAHRALMVELAGKERQIERLLTAAGVDISRPTHRRARPSRSQNGSRPGTRVGEARLAEILDLVARSEPNGTTGPAIADKLGLSKSAVTHSLQVLREQERVRLVGPAPRTEGMIGTTPRLYRLMNGHEPAA